MEDIFIENMCNFVVGIVSADDLAPIGARASAGNVMTKLHIRDIGGLMSSQRL